MELNARCRKVLLKTLEILQVDKTFDENENHNVYWLKHRKNQNKVKLSREEYHCLNEIIYKENHKKNVKSKNGEK